MVTLKVSEDRLLELMVGRIKHFTDDEDVIKLYENMYEDRVYGGCYDGCEFDLDNIVDNDWFYLRVICEGEDGFEAIDNYYENNGLGDCSMDSECDCNYIEAKFKDMYLVG